MTTSPQSSTLGVWFVGARGSIATLTAVCAQLIARGIVEPVGLLTERAPYVNLPLTPLGYLRFGGCDIREEASVTTLDALVADGLIPPSLRDVATSILSEIDSDIACVPRLLDCTQQDLKSTTPPIKILGALRQSLAKFKTSVGSGRVVVVNVASTEESSSQALHLTTLNQWTDLEAFLEGAGPTLPWGVLYACAALLEDCAYINFTPNTGTELPALEDLAVQRHLPHAGKDGKTGETLLKTALAPLFEARALRVMSWVGYNILGNSDGLSLTNPGARDAKMRSKDLQLQTILRHSPNIFTKVGIDYVPSLGDWKTAWDFIHFEGILGAKMSLQFTWQGADSILAAPLVLDLIRLVDLAWTRNEEGPLSYLAAFFKHPIGCSNHDFWVQMKALETHFGFQGVSDE